MSTINLRSGLGKNRVSRGARPGNSASDMKALYGVDNIVCLKFDLNFAKHNLGSGDIFQLHDLPIGTRVLGAMLKIVTLEGGTLTVDIGYAGGSELFNDVNLNDALGTTPVNIANDTGGNAARILTVLANNAADTARIVLGVFCYQLP
jgi:hypothetical protein